MEFKFWKSLSDNSKGKILFVHGYATTSNYFDGIAKKLIDDFDYYAVELPGMGISGLNDLELSPISYAKQIIEWIKKENLTDLYLIGHSMGGGIALLLANLAPSLFKKMIAICPMNSSIHIKLLNAFKLTPTKNPKQVFNAQKYIYSDYQTRFPLKDNDHKIIELWNYQKSIKLNTKKLFSKMSSIKNNSLLKEAEKNIKIPSLLITAANDMIIDSNSAIKKITKNKNFQNYVVQNSGHCPFEEKEFETLTVIKRFLES